MKRPATRSFLRGAILLSLSAGRVGCFIVSGAGRPSITAYQLRPSRRVDRPLQQTRHPPSRAAGSSVVGFGWQGRLAQRAGSGRNRYLGQKGVRLLASAPRDGGQPGDGGDADAEGDEEKEDTTLRPGHLETGRVTKEDVERNYTPEEREFVASFEAAYEAAEEPRPDEDDLAVYDNDYKMYAEGTESLSIEWDAAMGKTDSWGLPPFEEFDPKIPPVHYKYYEDDLQANLRSEVNPFPLHSEWVDRDIKAGDIDEAKKEAIEPMMSVIELVCELIDTTDDVFSFKYVGPIRHKKGIASWTMVLIKRLYPEVKGVEFVTNRTRDRTDW